MTASKAPMASVQPLQEPSKKGRGQGHSLPSKFSVWSGQSEAGDPHQPKTLRDPEMRSHQAAWEDAGSWRGISDACWRPTITKEGEMPR